MEGVEYYTCWGANTLSRVVKEDAPQGILGGGTKAVPHPLKNMSNILSIQGHVQC